DEPRPGAPRKLGDAEMARLITTALGGGAEGAARRWTSRALAAQMGVSQSTVSRVIRGMGLQPETAEAFRLAVDPHYIEKVRDVVGLYMDAPLRAVALCVDDRRPRDPQPRWPSAVPVLPPRHALAGPRYGDTTLFEALDRAACGALGNAGRGAGLRPFLEFLRALDEAVPAERSVHVVIDDNGRRKRPMVERWFQRTSRFRLVLAPSCHAWLAQFERWFALLAMRPSSPGREPGTAALERAVRAYLQRAGSAPFAWITREPEEIRATARSATS
ncbi:MAG TPA: IS630 family transposase, partial [Albitalea sp.]